MRLPTALNSRAGLWPLLLLLASCTAGRDQTLRLRKVVLYQNGIGYFEHSGQAQSDKLRISVRRSELDDALKTLTIVSRASDGLTPRHGTVHTMTGDEAEAKKKRPDEQRTVPMEVQIPKAGGEELRVSYSVPTPIWKATYRVVFSASKEREVLLQGWAAVQNTSGHDWHNVALTLATGAPLSFGVNLTRPTYSARPDLAGQMHMPVALGAVRATSTRPSDQDGDGILDAQDLCPLAGEDLDGFEDADGCPDLDNDFDRILDVDDQCPGDSETYNGVDDKDGCPDRGTVIIRDAKLTILDRVYFTANSSELKAASRPILDAVAAALQANREITEVEVQGHADANEKDAWSLAEDRAVVVAAYLVRAGVERGRLRMQSYGDSVPLSTQKGQAAHAKNRRIDFLILRRDQEDHAAAAQGARVGAAGAQSARASAVAAASLVPSRSASGGMVHYELPSAVSIPNGESTLVPLINAKVEGEEIYLFKPDENLPGSDQHPSRAVRVVNTGDLALVPGPIAVFARDAFAGEGLLGALSPNESAFIPFALDRSAQVLVNEASEERPKNILSIVETSILVVDHQELTTEYTLRAGLTPPKRVFVQHATHAGYQLTPPDRNSMAPPCLRRFASPGAPRPPCVFARKAKACEHSLCKGTASKRFAATSRWPRFPTRLPGIWPGF
jgi:outer membrane protein OmpA-like peptidoglycan-associated protein